jgi:hypothetical protein
MRVRRADTGEPEPETGAAAAADADEMAGMARMGVYYGTNPLAPHTQCFLLDKAGGGGAHGGGAAAVPLRAQGSSVAQQGGCGEALSLSLVPFSLKRCVDALSGVPSSSSSSKSNKKQRAASTGRGGGASTGRR